MTEQILVLERVDGWTIENDDGVLIARTPDRIGFVAFNDDGSGLYVADVAEVPFLVVDALRARQDKL